MKYKYLLQDKENGGKLYLNLRHKHKRYRERYGSGDKREQIPNRRSIDERPKIVDRKERIRDFEIDLVIGKNHKRALITLVDRKSKFTILNKIPYKKSSLVQEAVVEMLVPIKP
jgi:IS30 family transposase